MVRLAYSGDEDLADDGIHALLCPVQTTDPKGFLAAFTIAGKTYLDVRHREMAAREIRDALRRGLERIVDGAEHPAMYLSPRPTSCPILRIDGKPCGFEVNHPKAHSDGRMVGKDPRTAKARDDFVILGRHPHTGINGFVDIDGHQILSAQDLQDLWHAQLMQLFAVCRGTAPKSEIKLAPESLRRCEGCSQVFIAPPRARFCARRCGWRRNKRDQRATSAQAAT